MKKILLSALVGFFSIAAIAQTRLSNSQTGAEKLNDEYCTGLFKSTEGIILDLQDTNVGAYFNILDWLDGRVAGLKVYTLKNNIRVPFIRSQRTSIYVDEVEVNDSYLNSLPTSDIAMIKVIRAPFFGGFNGSGGAIAIYTFGVEADDEDSTK